VNKERDHVHRRAPVWLAVAIAISAATPRSLADGNPLNTSETAAPSSAAAPPRGKNQFTALPVVGGTSDIGVGGGFFAGLTRNAAGYTPYVWNVEMAGFISFLVNDGKVVVPYTDIYSKVTVERFLGEPLELVVRPSFTNELKLNYYGMGNASSATPSGGMTSRYFEYARMHPELVVDVRFKILDHVVGRVGLRYIESFYSVPTDSKLAADIRSASPEVKSLIGPTHTEGAALFRYGLQFDSRDNEVSPHQGSFDELSFNFSPGGIPALPFRYGEASLNLRGYLPLFSKRFTLALRLVGDVLFGDAPFFELSRAVDNYAIGGSNGIRGVPSQRYRGKAKIIANVEVRARLFDFHLLKKPFTIGAAAIFDGGRLWADTSSHPELDGRTLGLKFGVGGGLRLMSGTAFVLRADLAWSPDATPVGGYVIAGECF
jgi:Omp85 superfamily domain